MCLIYSGSMLLKSAWVASPSTSFACCCCQEQTSIKTVAKSQTGISRTLVLISQNAIYQLIIFRLTIMQIMVSITLYLQSLMQFHHPFAQGSGHKDIARISCLYCQNKRSSQLLAATCLTQPQAWQISIAIRPYDSRARKKINSTDLIVSTHVIAVVLWVQRLR